MSHIIERELIHFFCCPGIILCLTFAMAYLQRKKHLSFLPVRPLPTTMLCALLVLPFAFVREPFDVAGGDWAGKSAFDFAFWALGCAVTPWALYRLHKWWDEWGD